MPKVPVKEKKKLSVVTIVYLFVFIMVAFLLLLLKIKMSATYDVVKTTTTTVIPSGTIGTDLHNNIDALALFFTNLPVLFIIFALGFAFTNFVKIGHR